MSEDVPEMTPAAQRRHAGRAYKAQEVLDDIAAENVRLRDALRGLLSWRRAVNDGAGMLLSGIESNPEGVAVALFNGPIWDTAQEAFNG